MSGTGFVGTGFVGAEFVRLDVLVCVACGAQVEVGADVDIDGGLDAGAASGTIWQADRMKTQRNRCMNRTRGIKF
jgi:hypothetical protein